MSHGRKVRDQIGLQGAVLWDEHSQNERRRRMCLKQEQGKQGLSLGFFSGTWPQLWGYEQSNFPCPHVHPCLWCRDLMSPSCRCHELSHQLVKARRKHVKHGFSILSVWGKKVLLDKGVANAALHLNVETPSLSTWHWVLRATWGKITGEELWSCHFWDSFLWVARGCNQNEEQIWSVSFSSLLLVWYSTSPGSQ